MSTDDLVREIDRLFAASDDRELLDRAEAAWPTLERGYDANLAEIARFARVVAYRQGTGTEDVWQARAIEAAVTSGNLASLSLSFQVYVYRSAINGRFADAHTALDVMELLAALPTAGAAPESRLVQRILAERRAYVFRCESRWPEALEWYQKSKSFASSGSRGEAKVDGGTLIVNWLSGAIDADDACVAFTELADRSTEWPDVHDAAVANSNAAHRRAPADVVPFDLL